MATFISCLPSSLAGNEVGLCSLGNTEVIHFFPEEGRVLPGTLALSAVVCLAWLLFGSAGVSQWLGIPGIVL